MSSSPLSPAGASPDEELEKKLNWLDQLRADAGTPKTVNAEDAVLVHFSICDEEVSTHTYRRWPVKSFFLGRERRYYLAAVIAFAKKRFEEAAEVDRTPPQRPRAKRIRPATIQSPPVAVNRRESVGQQSEISEEVA